jgi:hypothetical protein
VPGVSATPDRPPTLDAGASWPVLRNERVTMGGCALEVRWYVMVVGPGADEGSTIASTDPVLAPLIAALKSAGLVIEAVEPVRIPVEPGNAGVPAIRVGCVDNAWIG